MGFIGKTIAFAPKASMDIAKVSTKPGGLGGALLGGEDDDPATYKQRREESLKGQARSLADRQVQQAKDFRKGLPGYQQAQMDIAGDNSRRGLAQQMAGTKTGANQRGLLYSGLHQGQQSNDLAGYNAALSQRRAQINEQSMNQANQMDEQALDRSFGQLSQEIASNQNQYDTEEAKRKSNKGVIGSFTGALGSLGGGLMGGRG